MERVALIFGLFGTALHFQCVDAAFSAALNDADNTFDDEFGGQIIGRVQSGRALKVGLEKSRKIEFEQAVSCSNCRGSPESTASTGSTNSGTNRVPFSCWLTQGSDYSVNCLMNTFDNVFACNEVVRASIESDPEIITTDNHGGVQVFGQLHYSVTRVRQTYSFIFYNGDPNDAASSSSTLYINLYFNGTSCADQSATTKTPTASSAAATTTVNGPLTTGTSVSTTTVPTTTPMTTQTTSTVPSSTTTYVPFSCWLTNGRYYFVDCARPTTFDNVFACSWPVWMTYSSNGAIYVKATTNGSVEIAGQYFRKNVITTETYWITIYRDLNYNFNNPGPTHDTIYINILYNGTSCTTTPPVFTCWITQSDLYVDCVTSITFDNVFECNQEAHLPAQSSDSTLINAISQTGVEVRGQYHNNWLYNYGVFRITLSDFFQLTYVDVTVTVHFNGSSCVVT
ncbi:hypothetical protein BV898_05960 [Hypsibius exemplaris]|uniref:CUB domain-containing protein n=1 Tax=Hypsibius exemplaris TaxID=2072580 RepID=A0A1W0WXM5_HYPEX|nr:hypothetical protein BV898_05960 [Hypsibius exemplaris]